MIKRLGLVLCLVCGLGAGENQRNRFFGIEGGAGLLDVFYRYSFIATNPLFFRGLAPTLGYSVGISGGWQRYDYEKVGLRHTFGARFDWGTNMAKFGGKQKEDYKGGTAYRAIPFYYSFDGLFDFMKTDEKCRFGMSLGLSLKTGISAIKDTPYRPKASKDLGGFGLFSELTTGFYVQIYNEIIDFRIAMPILGINFGTPIVPQATATLGYKHLF